MHFYCMSLYFAACYSTALQPWFAVLVYIVIIKCSLRLRVTKTTPVSFTQPVCEATQREVEVWANYLKLLYCSVEVALEVRYRRCKSISVLLSFLVASALVTLGSMSLTSTFFFKFNILQKHLSEGHFLICYRDVEQEKDPPKVALCWLTSGTTNCFPHEGKMPEARGKYRRTQIHLHKSVPQSMLIPCH